MSSTAKELEEMERYTDDFTAYVEELRRRAGDNMLDYFAELRQFPREVIDEQKIFYIGDATEMLLPDFLDKIESFGVISPTNRKPIFHSRFVIPILDIHGKVLNLVGYSKEANERYVYGTAKYYRRRDCLYGLENLNMAYDMGYAIITEGITDTIRVRSLGYKNCFANCGTHSANFAMKQLNRCKNGVIKIGDRDEAGQRAVKKWICNRSITLNTFIKYKDIDSMCYDEDATVAAENIVWVKEYLDACIKWILQAEHHGKPSASMVVTIGSTA